MTAKLFLDDSYGTHFEAEVTAIGEKGIQLKKTIFYATSGGQPGDTGIITIANQNIPVIATIKGEGPDDIWHAVEGDIGTFTIGQSVRGSIDWDRRHRHMRMHTVLHLICSQVKGHITGCQIGTDKSRVDFDIATGAVDKDALNVRLNELIHEDHPITTDWISDEELMANPNLIRTMSVKPPMGAGRVRLVRIGSKDNQVDLQPCGGTHVKSTGEIGPVIITKMENKGKLNRRISVVFDEEPVTD